MTPNIIHMSRSYFHLNVYKAWTSLQTWLWRESWKNSGISLCVLLGSFRLLWTTGDQPLCLANLFQASIPAPRDAELFSKEAADSAHLPVNWAQQSHRIAIPADTPMQQLLKENSKSSDAHVGTHKPWNKDLHSGNEVNETRKVPVHRHLKHGKTGPESASV